MSPAANLARRAIRSSSPVRAIVKSQPAQRAINAQRAARVLRPTLGFLAGEAGVRARGHYEIRSTGRTVNLRHGSRDVEILNEIFSSVRRSYEPPPQAARALAELGPLRVTDLGANIGLFALYALARWPVRELCSFEPDPANAALLHATIAANDEGPRWQLVASAISNEDTSALFQTGLYAESHLGTNHEGHGAIEVEVLDLFSRSPTDFLKMDIEGAEWAILEDPRLASYSARVIVLEWHKRMCPADDARTAARQLLRDAGYEPLAEDTAASAVNGVMWALRG